MAQVPQPQIYPPPAVPVVALTGLAMMPTPGSREAPKTFIGDASTLEDFLDRFEVLANAATLTSADKVVSVCHYMDRFTKSFIQTLDGYVARDWATLRASILAMFPDSSIESKYSPQTLQSIAAKQSLEEFNSLEEFMAFYRKFVTVARWLTSRTLILESDVNKLFWFSFQPLQRDKMERELHALQPHHNMSQPWTMADVFAVAKEMFNPIRFDRFSPLVYLGRNPQSIQGPRMDLGADEEIVEVIRRKRVPAQVETFEEHPPYQPPPPQPLQSIFPPQEVRTRTVTFAPPAPAPVPMQTQVTTTTTRPQETLDDLVGKLAEMSIHDKNYAVYYAKLVHHYPNVAKELPRPRISGFYVSHDGQTVSQPSRQFMYQPGQTNQQLSSNQQAPLQMNGPRPPRLCYFCQQPAPTCMGVNYCRLADQYIAEGKLIRQDNHLRFPDGSRIPQQPGPGGIKIAVDARYASAPNAPASTPKNMLYLVDSIDIGGSSSFYNGHANAGVSILKRQDSSPPSSTDSASSSGTMSSSGGLSAVYTRSQSARAKSPTPTQQNSQSQPINSQPSQRGEASRSNLSSTQRSQPSQASTAPRDPQYHLRANVESPKAYDDVFSKLLEGQVKITNEELLAISPEVRKRVIDLIKTVKKTPALQEVEEEPQASNPVYANIPTPDYQEPPREIDIELPNGIRARGVVDTASSIVQIDSALREKCGHPVNMRIATNMTTADNSKATLHGCAEMLPITVGPIVTLAHAHIKVDAPCQLLLGTPWIKHCLGMLRPETNGDWTFVMSNPANPSHTIEVPTYPHGTRIPQQMPHYYFACPVDSIVSTIQEALRGLDRSLLQLTHPDLQRNAGVFAYKKVENKVRPVSTTLPSDLRVMRRRPRDPLLTLKPLSTHPEPFEPIGRITEERYKAFGIDTNENLLEEEKKLAGQVISNNSEVFGFSSLETTTFDPDYFPPIVFPLIEHVPWNLPTIPIPPGIAPRILEIIKQYIDAGIYELSGASYLSPIFWVVKKDNDYRLVNDLQELNRHTIKDSSLPPNLESYAEWFAGSEIYTSIDIMNGYYGRVIAEESRDVLTFSTPFGNYRLTRLPQGWTNSVQIFQADIAFILVEERTVTKNYIDDCPVKGPKTRYLLADGTEERIPMNPGIRRYVWEHLVDVNRILHRLGDAKITVSAKKFKICIVSIEVTGYICSKAGRLPDPRKTNKIENWPIPTNVSELKGFLGTVGDVRIFIHKFSEVARPLVDLTRKNVDFVWTDRQTRAMNQLKDLAINAPCIRPIDYDSGRRVYVKVDSSIIAVGWIILQDDENGKKVPSRYGSITWNPVQSRYSQPKIEFYGLFRALHASRIHLIGLPRFTVEMDAKFIKGMLNSPDVQPNAAINRWIAAVRLFDFDLVHVPAKDFKGPDGLSRRPKAEGDIDEGGDAEEWVDDVLSLGIWADTWCYHSTGEVDFTLVQSINASPLCSSIDAISYAYKKATEDDTRTPIPRTKESIELDRQLQAVFDFLSLSGRRPEGFDDQTWRKVISKAREFFVYDETLWHRRRNGMHQKVIFYPDRLELLVQAHNRLGHKKMWSLRRTLLDRFWWPLLEANVTWFVTTCHQCQLRNVDKFHIPPSITYPATLFAKVHVDTMFMEPAHGFRYIIAARCSLTGYVEARALREETARTVGAFLFEDILCRWGATREFVTDNGKPIVAAVQVMHEKYFIHHIRVSGYNSRANGVVERGHRTLREAMVTTCEGNIKQWPIILPFVLWSDRVTTRRHIGMSPFQMAHGIEPVLPFDVVHATFLAPRITTPLTTQELIAIRAKQLMKRDGDLAKIRERVIASRYASLAQFQREFANNIQPQDFAPGTLVLVRNVRAEGNLSGKHLPRYYGPMVVVSRGKNGAYRLGELDGSLSNTSYAGYRITPYYPRDPTRITVTDVFDRATLAAADSSDEIEEAAPLPEDEDTYVPRQSRRIRGMEPDEDEEEVIGDDHISSSDEM